MTKDEALKLALEALDCIYSPLHVREINKVGAAMAAIKEALTQPDIDPERLDQWVAASVRKHQRTWQGLTDEELAEFSKAKLGAYDLCLEVEAKLKEKNA